MKHWKPSLMLAALLLLAACGGGDDKSTAEEPGAGNSDTGRPVIGATCLTTDNPFFITIEEAMREEANKHGYDLIYLSGDQDVQKQNTQVKDFIVRKVAAIAINPCDSKAIGPAIREANEAGIPVFTFDIKVQDPEAEVVAHVGTNNFQGGQLAGQAMSEALGEGGGKVVILDFQSVESCQERVRGFKDFVQQHNQDNPGSAIEVVAELPGEGNQARGFKAAEDAIQAHPQMEGIFAINDPSGVGAVAALEKAGKLDEVAVVAFDGQMLGKEAIRDGKIYADPVQFPEKIGRETVKAVIAYFEGEEVKPEILIDSALYRQEDALKDPELQR